jgi:KUP system potassium uptake protein
VLNGIWSTPPPAEDVIGGVSAIIWALTLLPLLKYVSVLVDEVLHVLLTAVG